MKKFADTVRRLLSIALNLFIVWAEPIALPMSWDWGKEQMFIFYTEDSNILSACICAMTSTGSEQAVRVVLVAAVSIVLCWLVAAVTAISGIKYLWDNRSFINTAK